MRLIEKKIVSKTRPKNGTEERKNELILERDPRAIVREKTTSHFIDWLARRKYMKDRGHF